MTKWFMTKSLGRVREAILEIASEEGGGFDARGTLIERAIGEEG